MVSEHPLFSLGEQFSNFLIPGLFVLKIIEDPKEPLFMWIISVDISY